MTLTATSDGWNCCSGRAKLRVEELERLLEIAKKNFVQLGGTLSEERRRIREMRDKDQWVHNLFGFDLFKLFLFWGGL